MHVVGRYEWAEVRANERDPNAGGASHEYRIALDEGGGTAILFQHGPRSEATSIRGVLDEHLLMIVADRLEAFQAGPFAHPSNLDALDHVQAARKVLKERAEERRVRGVLGKNEK